jgi:tetratricopeptide (TPR) repeat protein
VIRTTLALGLLAVLFGCDLNAEHRLRIGNDFGRGGQLEAARESFDRVRAAYPNQARAHALAGNVAFQLELWSDAQSAWKAALALDPTNDLASIGLCHLLIEEGRFQAAMVELDRLAERSPSSLDILLLRARALLGRGESTDAARGLLDLEFVLSRQAHSTEALYLKGLALLSLGRVDDAHSTFDRLGRLERSSPLSELGFAFVASAKNRPSEVILHLRAAKANWVRSWPFKSLEEHDAFTFVRPLPEFLALFERLDD